MYCHRTGARPSVSTVQTHEQVARLCHIREKQKLVPREVHGIKWKHFPRYWPFVRGIHRPPVNSPHKGQWRRALMFSLICAWINGWVKQWWGWWFETPSRSLWRHCIGERWVAVVMMVVVCPSVRACTLTAVTFARLTWILLYFERNIYLALNTYIALHAALVWFSGGPI